MSIKFQRFEAPPEGQTILIKQNSIWNDPAKPENAPLPKLESEKGVLFPTWTQLLTGGGALSALGYLVHRTKIVPRI